jgi:hypothetical protein
MSRIDYQRVCFLDAGLVDAGNPVDKGGILPVLSPII